MSNNIAITFPGQGSQVIGMGKDLFDNFQVAKDVFHQVDEVLKYKLSEIIFNGENEELTQTNHAQPALMATSIAIFETLKQQFNINLNDIAKYSAGHSLGEYCALCASGALSLEDTANLLKIRGNAMKECGSKSDGAMAAIIGSTPEVIQELIDDVKQDQILQIANDNSNGQIVISGQKAAVERFVTKAKEFKIRRAILLPVSGAFHSQLMQKAQEIMIDAINSTNFNKPAIAIINNVNAKPTRDIETLKDLLGKQVTSQVKWRQTILFLQENNIDQVLEIGSGKVLCGLFNKTAPDIKTLALNNIADIEEYAKTI